MVRACCPPPAHQDGGGAAAATAARHARPVQRCHWNAGVCMRRPARPVLRRRQQPARCACADVARVAALGCGCADRQALQGDARVRVPALRRHGKARGHPQCHLPGPGRHPEAARFASALHQHCSADAKQVCTMCAPRDGARALPAERPVRPLARDPRAAHGTVYCAVSDFASATHLLSRSRCVQEKQWKLRPEHVKLM